MRNLVDHPLILVVLVLLIVVIFGAKRLPDAARSLGRSMRIFKSEVKEMKTDGKEADGRTPGSPSSPLEGRLVDGEREAPRYESRPTDSQRHGA